MKALTVTILALSLAACSSTATKQAGNTDPTSKAGTAATRFAESSFDGTAGTLNLVFDDQGNWTKITAKGTASLGEDTSSARETSLMIATLRAKRSVAEFLNNDVKSSKTLTRVARSYARAFQSEHTKDESAAMNDIDSDAIADLDIDGKGVRAENARQAQRFASVLTERIQDNSAAILKGAYVSHRVLQDGQVVVELTTTRQSVAAAHQVSGMMRGTLQ
jgi:uncharacterized lipoprotein YmbA